MDNLLTEKGIPIKKADIGNISKKDVSEAQSNYEKNPVNSVILGFNVELGADVKVPDEVKIINNQIIYKLLEDFEEWRENKTKELEAGVLDEVTRPVKVHIMPNMIFRQNNPAICGTSSCVIRRIRS